MIKQVAWAAISLLNLVEPVSEVKYDTTPIELTPKKVTKSRKKHICRWSDQEVWGAVLLALLVGIFLGYLI